jgi:hypothetical protein
MPRRSALLGGTDYPLGGGPVDPPPGSITHGIDIRNANGGNVGLLVATTTTHNGFLYDSAGAFAGHSISGNGAAGSPYVIDRRRYTSDVRIRNTAGVYAKFTNCRFEGDPGIPTPGGSAFVWVEDTGAFVEITDSTLTTAGGPTTATNPPGGGCDKGFLSYVPFTLRRCDISMAAVLCGFEIGRTESASLVEDCYMHNVWSNAGDHTDIINGNFHASHVTVRRCWLDGIRTGDTYVVNGFGIYDDPADSTGIIEDWTISSNYVERCQTVFLSNTSTSRFLAPFVVTDNIIGDFNLQLSSMRLPTSQSANRRADGTPVIF